MTNWSKSDDPRFWAKWKASGAISRGVGEAYTFFDCSASYDQINKELQTIRDLVKTPSALELSLFEDVNKINRIDKRLSYIVAEARDSGMKYAIKASLNSSTNESVADEVSTILNQAYHSPLYQEGELFRGEVTYQDKGEYVFRE